MLCSQVETFSFSSKWGHPSSGVRDLLVWWFLSLFLPRTSDDLKLKLSLVHYKVLNHKNRSEKWIVGVGFAESLKFCNLSSISRILSFDSTNDWSQNLPTPLHTNSRNAQNCCSTIFYTFTSPRVCQQLASNFLEKHSFFRFVIWKLTGKTAELSLGKPCLGAKQSKQEHVLT